MSLHIAPDALQALVAAILATVGCAEGEAEVVARHLVGANLVGHDSHGAVRIVAYVDRLRTGAVFANRQGRAVVDRGSILVVDGDNGFGQAVAEEAVGEAIARASTNGLSALGLRNVAHIGRLGHYAELAAASGIASVLFVNTTGFAMVVAPFGGTERRLPTNPASIGFPRREGPPVIWDIATSAVAEGKVKLAALRGTPLPEGALIAKDGTPTTDAAALAAGGAILPFGGHKGSGLAVMCELLAGAISGGGCAKPGAPFMVNNLLGFFFDPAVFGELDTIDSEADRLLGWVKSARPVDERSPVRMPGEVEAMTRATRLTSGIPFETADWGEITGLAKSLDLPPSLIPQPLDGSPSQ